MPYPNCQSGSPPNLALRRPPAPFCPLSGILPLHRHQPRPRTPENRQNRPNFFPLQAPRTETRPPKPNPLPSVQNTPKAPRFQLSWYLTPTTALTPAPERPRTRKMPPILDSPKLRGTSPRIIYTILPWCSTTQNLHTCAHAHTHAHVRAYYR